MRPATGNFASYLAANRYFILADLYTFRLVSNEALYYSGFTVPFTVDQSNFDASSINARTSPTFALGPRFGRSKATTKIGLQADTLDVQIMAAASDTVGNLTWQNAFRLGVFDGATVELGRLLVAPGSGQFGGAIQGYVVWFQGYVGEAEIGRSLITLKVNSMLGLLNVQYPRKLWQDRCTHVFGDVGCGFDRQSMNATLSCGGGSTQSAVAMAVSPNPSNLYDSGTIVGISGLNTGYKRTIGQLLSGVAYLTAPFIYPVSVGDVFEMLPGCDHQVSTCLNVFNNLSRFGGMPYIPPAEFAV